MAARFLVRYGVYPVVLTLVLIGVATALAGHPVRLARWSGGLRTRPWHCGSRGFPGRWYQVHATLTAGWGLVGLGVFGAPAELVRDDSPCLPSTWAATER